MFQQAFKNIDDVLWKDAGCTSELDYTEQSSWILFLKYLDAMEAEKAMEAELGGKKCTHILDAPYRWESWAAPKGKDGNLDHNALSGDDLREQNPNGGQAVTHRSPQEIIAEIAALDAESAAVLAGIWRLL
jgi:type I restriction enzyme M protein